MVTKTELLECTNTKRVWMAIQNEKLLRVNFILILIQSLNDKFDTQKLPIHFSSQ
jgi:hypothetical protein